MLSMRKKRIRLAMRMLGLAVLALPGCVRIQEAAGPVRFGADASATAPRSNGERTAGSIWPKRWSKVPGARGAIVPLDGPLSEWVGVRLGENHYLRSTPLDARDVEALARVAGKNTGYQYELEGPGAFIFKSVEFDWEKRATDSSPDAMFKFISGRPVGSKQGVEEVMIERTWFAYYDAAASTPPRGLIVIVPGLFGVPEPVNDRFVEICRADGWAVLRLLAEPSRYTERVRFEIDLADLDSAAQAIADEFAQRAAETAYAVDAGVRHVHALRPGLRSKRHVLIGMSGGAMASPTVYALDPDRFDAAVLIAGGANFLLINEESNYAGWIKAIDFDWKGAELSADEKTRVMKDLAEKYLARCPLDGYHLAPQMRQTPVLVLQGSNDRAVPAKYGDLLWERLGKPERWLYRAGHEWIFLTLNSVTPQILKWLDERLDVQAEAGP
ncbi:MAG: hypothetical protein Kow0022_10730 [Phycisphaerales bacterium]